MNVPTNVMNIIKKLNTVPNTTTLIVGGAVRDAIMGIEPHDYDLVTNVPMETIEEMFKTLDIGKSKDFGLICVVLNGESYEISQFRDESEVENRNDSKNIKIL